jgi:UDP-glucose:tetrahydrobiopterin glucosyltransferase
LVAAEAQAAGTPVVAFARGGLTEVIDDAVTGFLVEPGNVTGAIAAVRSVATLDRRRCRQHAIDDLDFDACLAGYEALYASVSAPMAKDADVAGNG